LVQAFPVADIEEGDATVIATAVDPAAKSDFLAVEGLVQLAAIVAAHHGVFASLWESGFHRDRPPLAPADRASVAKREIIYGKSPPRSRGHMARRRLIQIHARIRQALLG